MVVGAYHEALQQRRRDQQSEEFQLQMHQRNAIEGTISELVRSHGLRRARYRGFPKVDLQNQFIAAACNSKDGSESSWEPFLQSKEKMSP
jgi:transposase